MPVYHRLNTLFLCFCKTYCYLHYFLLLMWILTLQFSVYENVRTPFTGLHLLRILYHAEFYRLNLVLSVSQSTQSSTHVLSSDL